MLKARGRLHGKDTVFIGLSFANLRKFKDEAGDTYICIQAEQLDMPFDILIFSGETEDHLSELFLRGAAPASERKQ